MGLSNISMTEARAREILHMVAGATKKWGLQASAPVSDADMREAIVVISELQDLDLIADRDALKAENTKLKQQLAGQVTAYNKLKGKL